MDIRQAHKWVQLEMPENVPLLLHSSHFQIESAHIWIKDLLSIFMYISFTFRFIPSFPKKNKLYELKLQKMERTIKEKNQVVFSNFLPSNVHISIFSHNNGVNDRLFKPRIIRVTFYLPQAHVLVDPAHQGIAGLEVITYIFSPLLKF